MSGGSAVTGSVTIPPFAGVSLSELRRRASSGRDDEALRLLRAVGGPSVPRKRTVLPSFDELLFGVVDEGETKGETETTTITAVAQQKAHTAGLDGRKRRKGSWAQRTIEKQRDGRRVK